MKRCLQCATEFLPKRKEQQYCSKSCASVPKGERRRGQRTGPQKGRVYRRRIDRDGYVRINGVLHPYRDGRLMILEHVMVMERAMGRRLGPNECVHHKDGNRKHNHLSNLQLMTKSEHSRGHAKVNVQQRQRTETGTFA